jgi:hypothetical protein
MDESIGELHFTPYCAEWNKWVLTDI